MIDKQQLIVYLKSNKFISIPDKFTGQVVLTININQGGITDIEKAVKERMK